ncbi:MAG: aminotransferase class I/II-fold pyridoxal phosphate-dependent enzyme [Candidatus Rokubacteria bacterium]|nr:aminotransferase class I/II-fold pyridoxal phosphate-dependent enzyme [Candidatus Rokubacteria bacterium]
MMRFETIAARGGRDLTSASRPLTPPIYQTSVYAFETMETVEAVWEGKEPGFVYGRYGSPNTAMLETMVAALEGGEAAVACASGMGALTALFLGLLRPGDHLVAAQDLYGTTTAFLNDELRRFGVETAFVDATEPARVLAALTPRTRAVYAESVSNPLLKLVDLEALGAELRRRGVELIVDSTFASPAILRPLSLGATVVHHSATKFISGHGDVTAGIAVGRGELMERVRAAMIKFGTNLGPFDAWLAARGLRTLHVRLERQSANALALARFLEGRREVARVYYPGLASHPQHELAQRLFKNGAGAMCAFDLKGGALAVERFMTGLRLIEFAPSFGEVATTWSYPLRTSHRRIPPAELEGLGIGLGLVRLSVGLEAVEDLMEDLTGALERART